MTFKLITKEKIMSNIILNNNNKIIGSSNNQQTDNSIIVDQYGCPVERNGFDLCGIRMKRYDNIYGFFKLNDVHNAIKDTKFMSPKKHWESVKPGKWYRPDSGNANINGFLDAMYNSNPEPYDHRKGPENDIDIPDYVTVGNDGEVEDTDLEPNEKPYPIKVISTGRDKGIYGPILTVLKYAAWIYPVLELEIFKLYNYSRGGRDLTSIVNTNLVTSNDNYHSIEEAEFTFNKRFSKSVLLDECGLVPYPVRINTATIDPKHSRLYHNDVWWFAYGIPEDKWLNN
jgi:hypothetical protein